MRLFETLRGMTQDGLSIIFISHKLHEVMAASDRVAVLRGGRLVATRETARTSADELAELMVGHQVTRPVREARPPGAPVIRAENVTVSEQGDARLDRVSFSVSEGEILGIVGVSGNGQAALGALLSGTAAPSSGRLVLGDHEIGHIGPRALIARGVGRIPEDRHAEGTVGELTVWENAVLERLRSPEFSRWGFVQRDAARDHTSRLIQRFDIRGAEAGTRIRLLSGGNMQKLILGRVLSSEPRFILANQPTRGLDEGAIAAVHSELLKARARGAAILLITEELEEAAALADRIQAMVKGRLSSPVLAEAADARRLGLMMAGVWDEGAGDAA